MYHPYKIFSVLSTLLSSTPPVERSTTTTPSGLTVHSVPLRRNDENSPWAYAASVTGQQQQTNDDNSTPLYNFLATQVWPSARYAAATLERLNIDKEWRVCELGCGPALPSLTLAKTCGIREVIATDIDPIALEMVQLAADQQGLSSHITTQIYNLIQDDNDDDNNSNNNNNNHLPEADLYILSDVFESTKVAIGAAQLTCQILASSTTSRVWVFAQTDRVQRESYLQYLKRQLTTHPSMRGGDDDESLLQWKNSDENFLNDSSTTPPPRLWLCDIDETKVSYY